MLFYPEIISRILKKRYRAIFEDCPFDWFQCMLKIYLSPCTLPRAEKSLTLRPYLKILDLSFDSS